MQTHVRQCFLLLGIGAVMSLCGGRAFAQNADLEGLFAGWKAEVNHDATNKVYLVAYPAEDGVKRVILVSEGAVQANGQSGYPCALIQELPKGMAPKLATEAVKRVANLTSTAIPANADGTEHFLAIPTLLVPSPNTEWRKVFDEYARRSGAALNPGANGGQRGFNPPVAQPAEGLQEEFDRLSLEREAVIKEIEIWSRSAEDFDRRFQQSVRDPHGVPSSLSAVFSISASSSKRGAEMRLGTIDRRLAAIQRQMGRR